MSVHGSSGRKPFDVGMSDDNAVVQQLGFMQRDIAEIKELVTNLEDQFDLMSSNMEQIFTQLNRLSRHDRPHPRSPTTYSRSASRSGSAKKQKTNADNPSEIKERLCLQDALQQNISTFVNDLDITGTSIADRLLSSECITDDECSVITSERRSRKDRVRSLVCTMRKRSANEIREFIDIVGEDYPHLKEKILETKKRNLERDLKDQCTCCQMRKNVPLKDIIDRLWEHKIITDEFYESIIGLDDHLEQANLWDQLIFTINRTKDPKTTIEILIECLKKKHKSISDQLIASEIETLQCSCKRNRMTCRKQRIRYGPTNCYDTDSQTDLSTTSDRLPRWSELFTAGETSDGGSSWISDDLLSPTRQYSSLPASFVGRNPYNRPENTLYLQSKRHDTSESKSDILKPDESKPNRSLDSNFSTDFMSLQPQYDITEESAITDRGQNTLFTVAIDDGSNKPDIGKEDVTHFQRTRHATEPFDNASKNAGEQSKDGPDSADRELITGRLSPANSRTEATSKDICAAAESSENIYEAMSTLTINNDDTGVS